MLARFQRFHQLGIVLIPSTLRPMPGAFR
jgi:hypothetical protein